MLDETWQAGALYGRKPMESIADAILMRRHPILAVCVEVPQNCPIHYKPSI